MQIFRLSLQRSLLVCACVLWTYAVQAQHLVSYQFQRSYSIADVTQLLDDAGIPSALLRPEFPVDVYKVIYNTRNAQDTGMTTASGVIIVPTGVTCPLPLLSYQHGTTTTRTGVPSYGSDELIIGIVYASGGGYICVEPDYLGLGDGPGFHPYCHARSEATATVDLLRTARELRDTLGFELNEQLFLFGYSQGGHATMAAFKMLEEELANEFTVTAAAPMSGPYDISGVQATTITSGQPYASPSYLPYIIMGYQEAYGDLYTNLSDVFRAPYDSLIPIWYDGTNGTGYIDNRLPAIINDMLDSAYYADYLNNPNHIGRQRLRENDLYKWTPQAPLRIMYCDADQQVFPQNSVIAFDTMTARGAANVAKVTFGNYDHGGCVQFCLIDGFNFFAQYKDTRGGMGINVQTTALSSTTAQDASISANGFGGTAPYTYSWNNGATTATQQNIGIGTYVVRVQDARGCFAYQPATVGLAAGVDAHERQNTALFRLAPNPASQYVFVVPQPHLQGEYRLTLRNLLGQIAYDETHSAEHSTSISLQRLPAGMYVVEMWQDGKRLHSEQLVIER